MNEARKILAECWSELRSIQPRMSEQEREWFRNFLRAYYFASRVAAARIAPSQIAYFSVLASNSARREVTRRLKRREWESLTFAVLTAKPKQPTNKINRIEDVLIEFLDSKSDVAKVKSSHSPKRRLAFARFKVLKYRIVEMHFMLTPW
jgi:hypothetical protein